VGFKALTASTVTGNDAFGFKALVSNNTGLFNTAIGGEALYHNTMGNSNVALGNGAGFNATTGSNNIYIGTAMGGVAGESNACYIGSIFNEVSVGGVPVLVNAASKLGTIVSSKRFKENIKPMDKSSEVLLALRPVTFRYKKEIDPAGTSQSGLVAEDVEKVNPDLVIRDKEGKPYSVRYDQVNSMLLNEFLKEHKAFVEEQHNLEKLQATVARQQKQIEALTAGLEKVNAQLEVVKSVDQTAMNNR
jgi:trimeric autotransporter adhesin